MTGDNTLERHRNEFFSNVRHNRNSARMLDKEVQYDPAEIMDYEGTDSGIGGSGELATVTVVEINSSPTTTTYDDNSTFTSSPGFSNTPPDMSDTSSNGHGHNNSIIRRESIEKLREQQEADGSLCPDFTDCGTLPVSFNINSTLDNSKLDDSVDEIREQSSLVVVNHCASPDEKLNELSEKPEESNCALDCLSFTIQCCDCTIL